ncbi:AAA family ATPase [bacterium]|nr:AAA family ATPase [bacterium]
MYLSFYNLRKEPFHITPDPAFLYLSRGHKEALGAVIYGTEQRKGFVAITGEVGTGKTTVVRAYLERIDRTRVRPIYIFNANLSFKELLSTILMELGVEAGSDNVHAMVHRLHEVLIEEFRADHNVVLIIDEAQNMPIKTLENLRMLSNLETTQDKLLQIVLVGQPELEAKLNLPELRQLRQRIAFRAKIAPLSARDSYEYINFRLEKVVLSREPLFTKTALRRIVDYAQGSPRVINILCDNALIAGFGSQTKPVTAQIVKEVIADYEGRSAHRGSRLWRYAAAVVALGFLGVAASPYGRGWMEDLGLRVGQNEAEQPAARTPVPAPAVKPSPTPVVDVNREATDEDEPVAVEAPGRPRMAGLHATEEPVIEPIATPTPTPEPAATATPTPLPAPVALTPATAESVLPAAVMETATRAEVVEPPALAVPLVSVVQPPIFQVTSGRGVTRIVREGDFLSRLCVEVYGFSNSQVLELVREANPQIADVNRIMVGDVIRFPALHVSAPAMMEIGGK